MAGQSEMGSFAIWQSRYAEVGIATFPVSNKKPAIRSYLKVGQRASRELASRFCDADQFGFACKPNHIAVLDIDSPDERLLAEALRTFGPTPIVVRTGSGHFQAWYRHNGERRRIRPDPSVPIDLLGDGYVVGPPSAGKSCRYEIIEGSLQDVSSLPIMRGTFMIEGGVERSPVGDKHLGSVGRRNLTLWELSMATARNCSTIDELTMKAMELNNMSFVQPLAESEVQGIVRSAWSYQEKGRNWFGIGRRVVIEHSEVDGLLQTEPDAFILLTKLRRHHWGRDFVIANVWCKDMPKGGWSRKRLAAARSRLQELGHIVMVTPARGPRCPAVYRLQGGQI